MILHCFVFGVVDVLPEEEGEDFFGVRRTGETRVVAVVLVVVAEEKSIASFDRWCPDNLSSRALVIVSFAKLANGVAEEEGREVDRAVVVV